MTIPKKRSATSTLKDLEFRVIGFRAVGYKVYIGFKVQPQTLDTL